MPTHKKGHPNTRYKVVTLALLFATSSLTLTAQRIVEGIITDKNSGETLTGATIQARQGAFKTIAATISNEEGRYHITLPDNTESAIALYVSFVGYSTQKAIVPETTTGNAPTQVSVALTPDASMLNQVVVTGTRTPKLLKDAPIVTRLITNEDIKKTDATNIQDLLQQELPGVEFSYSMNQQTSLNMGGFAGNAVLFLVDGERMAGETLDNIDYSRLNLSGVDHIEIVKGAASSLYGSSAVGGVVNIITREPEETWELNLNTRFGAHNEQRYGGSLGMKLGKVASLTTMQHTKIDSYTLTDEKIEEGATEAATTTAYGSRTWNIKERLTYSPIDRLKLTGRLGYYFRERYSSSSSYDRYRDFSGGLKGEYSFRNNDFLELSYVFDQYDKSDYVLSSERDIRDYSNVQHTFRALYSHNFMEKNILTIGSDVMRDYLLSYQMDESHRQYTADAFAQAEWQLLANLSLITALRYDYFSEGDMSNFSPKLSLMYRIDNCALRFAYSGGFRAPSLKEKFMNYDMASLFMIYGNEDLKAETSQNLQLSAEYHKGNYNLTCTVFYNLVDNKITSVWNTDLGGIQYQNSDPMHIAGVELYGAARFDCGLGACLSYSYTHEYTIGNDITTSDTRPHSLIARVDYTRTVNKNFAFDLILSGRFLSKLTTTDYSITSYLSSDNMEVSESTYPAYTLWKLSAKIHLIKGLHVNLAVDNLFNYKPSFIAYNSPYTTGTTFTAGLSLDVNDLF